MCGPSLCGLAQDHDPAICGIARDHDLTLCCIAQDFLDRILLVNLALCRIARDLDPALWDHDPALFGIVRDQNCIALDQSAKLFIHAV
jgi:hypothetical protein